MYINTFHKIYFTGYFTGSAFILFLLHANILTDNI